MPAASQPAAPSALSRCDEIVVSPRGQRLVLPERADGADRHSAGRRAELRIVVDDLHAQRTIGVQRAQVDRDRLSGPRLSIQTCASVIWPAN